MMDFGINKDKPARDTAGDVHQNADGSASVLTDLRDGPMPPDPWDNHVPATEPESGNGSSGARVVMDPSGTLRIVESKQADTTGESDPQARQADEALLRQKDEAEAEAQRQADAEALLEKQREERLAPVRAMDIADVQRLLKKKMGTVLRAHKAHSEAVESQAECNTTWKESTEAAQLAFPTGNEKPPVQQFVEKSEHLLALAFEARRAAEKAKLTVEWCQHDYRTAVDELFATIVSIDEAKPELVDDEVLAAARFLHHSRGAFEEAIPEQALEQFVDLSIRDLTEPEQEQLTKDRETVFQAALQTSTALQLNDEYCDEYKENKTLRQPSVVQPTRPSEEEVQRYLSELEQFMLKRQLSDRRLLSLYDEREQTVVKLRSHEAELINIRDGVASLASTTEAAAPAVFAAVRMCATLILEKIAYVDALMPSDRAGMNVYDKTDEPTVSNSERKDIDRTRNHMRALGFAMGRLNEATVTFKAAERKRIRSVTFDGIVEADTKSWSDCTNWLAGKRKEQFAVGREMLSKSTKLELLQESVDAGKEEVSEKMVNLRRHVRACLAVGYNSPCNELRAIFNTSAWMCQVDNEEGTFKIKLVFPVFPIVE
jgi:hypothetical protein